MKLLPENQTPDSGMVVPQPAEPIYLGSSEDPNRLRFTWVGEVLAYTLNGCYKVTDKQGKTRIIKRYQAKDREGHHAWLAL